MNHIFVGKLWIAVSLAVALPIVVATIGFLVALQTPPRPTVEFLPQTRFQYLSGIQEVEIHNTTGTTIFHSDFAGDAHFQIQVRKPNGQWKTLNSSPYMSGVAIYDQNGYLPHQALRPFEKIHITIPTRYRNYQSEGQQIPFRLIFNYKPFNPQHQPVVAALFLKTGLLRTQCTYNYQGSGRKTQNEQAEYEGNILRCELNHHLELIEATLEENRGLRQENIVNNWVGDLNAVPLTFYADRKDPWGEPYLLSVSRMERGKVRSAGPDRKFFTGDDICPRPSNLNGTKLAGYGAADGRD